MEIEIISKMVSFVELIICNDLEVQYSLVRCRQCMTQERGILEQEPRLPPLKYDAEQPDIDDNSESEELVVALLKEKF